MQEPSREWEQTLSGIEPVRFEFSYNSPGLLRGIIQVAVLIPAVFMFSGVVAVQDSPFAREFMLVLAALVVSFDVGLALWYLYRRKRKPQLVEFRQGLLIVGRRSPHGHTDQEFNFLEMHDLHVTSGLQRYGWRGGGRSGPPSQYLTPEPFGFTYHGRACSFGGTPPTAQAAERFMSAAAAYDAAIRTRLGMAAEPNAQTLDTTRLSLAAEDGWDSEVPERALW